jgi:hypothetical protein
MTGGYPAEYGKKMGGVVEVTTTADRSPGLHFSSVLGGGSFDTGSAFIALQYGTANSSIRASADGFRTDRYLDPPVLGNFTNHGSGSGFTAAYERDLADRNRVRFSIARRTTDFEVPNELVQQIAGQRQDRKSGETAGQFAFDRIFSDSLLASVRVMSRHVSSLLGSNFLSTPIIADQDRGFRETYIGGNISAHHGSHEIKAGVEFSFAAIHENFGYQITAYDLNGIPMFDPSLPAQFRFQGSHNDRERSAFAQDTYHSGRLTINAGLRYDRYQFLTTEQAFSPRLAASWEVPTARLLVHAAYDRMFTTPAMENLLLSGSPEVRALFPEAEYIPVRPARGNSYQAGLTFRPAAKLRLDVTHYLRTTSDFGDDELLLNTGISFPIAFDRATVQGTEARLELVSTGRFSGVLSYTNMIGRARLPVAGGLFLPSEEEGLREFAITQDQRNTVSARIGARATKRFWTALIASYGSGLPVELEGQRPISFYLSQYGEEIVDRVNFERGRVRPNFSLDASAVAQLWTKDKRGVSVQFNAFNLTDRVNVINFAGLLSGTAVSNPRSFGARLRMEF